MDNQKVATSLSATIATFDTILNGLNSAVTVLNGQLQPQLDALTAANAQITTLNATVATLQQYLTTAGWIDNGDGTWSAPVPQPQPVETPQS